MAGTKKKKPRQPQKKKHPANEPFPGTNVLSWEVSSGEYPGVRADPDPAEDRWRVVSPPPAPTA